MNKLSRIKLALFVVFIFHIALFTSCREEYFKENNIPVWLGKSIYDYLENDGNYTNYLRLVDDLDYKEVLSKTGSKTVFVANDEAFKRFYEGNSWGVSSYEGFSEAQKKLILYSSMINNALLIEGLSKIEGPIEGQALRRATSVSVLDSIAFEIGDVLPDNGYWDRFRTKGVHLIKDNTTVPMLHFVQAQMNAKHITDDDFSILMNGKTRAEGDAYIYGVKVVERDITCQNGYIHVLEDLLIPPSNLADVIRDGSETKEFSKMLERFSAPYFHETLTQQYALLGGTDSVFVKGYFSERSNIVTYNATNSACYDPDGNLIPNVLLFDPGWNSYRASNVIGSFQTDMATIFVPTDAALKNYFETGAGRPLIERYGSVKEIPNEVLNKLVRNHMKASFLATLPSQFHTIVDDAQELMGVDKSHINKVYLASNGVAYVTNTVYTPALYSSVMFPATINENMKVFNWAIDQLEFDAYLLSMVNYYSFLLPTDNFMYISPTSLKKNQPEAWKFRFNPVTNSVFAAVHTYDPLTNEIGDSISVITSASTMRNHLKDMLDYHIIVGDIEDGKEYYRTKGGGQIRISRNGNQLQVAGGGDIQRSTTVPVQEIYDQTKETNGRGNGKTYVIDQPVQSPLRSVYEVVSTTPEFSEFFNLLQGYDDLWAGDKLKAQKYSIFYRDATNSGMDMNVRFLNTYHYTLYVPENKEVLKAIENGLPTWEEVELETDEEKRDALADKIIRFLRYHFQDNAFFLDNHESGSTIPYETATLNLDTETFYKLYLKPGRNSLELQTESDGTARVMTENGLYNIMARDFKFNTATPTTATTIETSSHIVIHQIDKCLYFE